MQDKHPRPSAPRPTAYSLRPTAFLRPAFTLTELLIVIAIIAVLAGLIAAAAVNAMRAANRSRITLEIKNLSGAVEDFKSQYGAYPPNGMNPFPTNNPTPGTIPALVQADFERMFKKAFPRHQEPLGLLRGLCGQATGVVNLEKGMRAEEALVFWLGGFSDDPKFPISGVGGPSYSDPDGDNDGNLEDTDEVFESRKLRYEFEPERLQLGRQVTYQVDLNSDGDTSDPGEVRRIQMRQYKPSKSEKPLVYFDVSRYKPGKSAGQYDVWGSDPDVTKEYVYALKQPRQGVTAVTDYPDVVFVDQGKFQILHPGLDDEWGYDLMQAGSWSVNDATELILYPEGPFIGDMGDTLTSFTDGTLEDAAEE